MHGEMRPPTAAEKAEREARKDRVIYHGPPKYGSPPPPMSIFPQKMPFPYGGKSTPPG